MYVGSHWTPCTHPLNFFIPSDYSPPLHHLFKGVDKGGAWGAEAPQFLRFILSNNIAVHCIFIYALNNIPAPPLLQTCLCSCCFELLHTTKLVYFLLQRGVWGSFYGAPWVVSSAYPQLDTFISCFLMSALWGLGHNTFASKPSSYIPTFLALLFTTTFQGTFTPLSSPTAWEVAV